MNEPLTPRAIRVGPATPTGQPIIEIELDDGRLILIRLDPAHGRAVSERIVECIDGRITARIPSRRVLVITLAPDTAATLPTEPARSA